MEIKRTKGEYKVTKSNFLVEATYKTAFTLQEMRLVLAMVSMIEEKEKEFRPITFSVSDFSETLGLKSAKYSTFKGAIHKLMSKSVEFKDPNIRDKHGKPVTIFTNWFHMATYEEGTGRITFIFHPVLRPYLLDMHRDFTTYKLGYVLLLKSMYGIRLYELGKKWSGTKTGEFSYSLDELKEKFGITEKIVEGQKPKQKSYSTYGNFKMKVLLPAINEINEKTDMKMDFEELKEGRKVVGIKFKVKVPKEEDQVKLEGSKNEETPPESKTATNEDLQSQVATARRPPDFDVMGEFMNFMTGDDKKSSQ